MGLAMTHQDSKFDVPGEDDDESLGGGNIAPTSGNVVVEETASTPSSLIEKQYTQKLRRAMFNELLRKEIAQLTDFISFPGFKRMYDPVLEQFVFVNGATGEVLWLRIVAAIRKLIMVLVQSTGAYVFVVCPYFINQSH